MEKSDHHHVVKNAVRIVLKLNNTAFNKWLSGMMNLAESAFQNHTFIDQLIKQYQSVVFIVLK